MSETIWSPLGMEFDAFYTLESDGGQEIGGSRAGIALRDFGRFGVFLLRNGVIDTTPVLPADWIESANRRSFVFDSKPIAMAQRDTAIAGGSIRMAPWPPSALPANRST